MSLGGYRLNIVISGKRNVGKSSIINSLLNQDIALVSDYPGTTTDPVYKTMELHPIGPVTIIDTPGIDDVGNLGNKRVQKAHHAFMKSDIGLLVVDDYPDVYFSNILKIFEKNAIPFLIVLNKIDMFKSDIIEYYSKKYKKNFVSISAKKNIGIEELKNKIVSMKPEERSIPMIPEFIKENDIVLLIIPIDTGAPKGRLIMPQVNAIREILDKKAFPVETSIEGIPNVLKLLSKKPDLVITDSQAIKKVSQLIPEDIKLTTFSILEARHKGDLRLLSENIEEIENLNDGDSILIMEGCAHRPMSEDIGRVKIPNWLKKYTGKELNFKFIAGKEFPDEEDLLNTKIIIHCGGCTLTRTIMMRRLVHIKRLNIPIYNYGVIISYLNGVLERVMIPDLL
ncbi:[FeFe] hydrogenase H-cluster maturation GTPase HydF [Oceanotoga teriensis]|uniref:Iron-only hydrogenase maturation protein HydF n=1 Tax=Oceanotoga teriensis TaxID=515440 RepID=A0AA45C4Z8_9BACT|nr:[FeFe] hydrogenase H-cluster maturation GTPase HydF [Oceanotoga teriensis]MDO7977674.1 [FeFe] hydrogenase H-cluster maturation GTPase HydF [Oceanotoga teriensis]PWJ87547.1 iron-only hydrogenase maturation protein HydF [Oceanotoga teriensis]